MNLTIQWDKNKKVTQTQTLFLIDPCGLILMQLTECATKDRLAKHQSKHKSEEESSNTCSSDHFPLIAIMSGCNFHV
jgi:hypothetical protein